MDPIESIVSCEGDSIDSMMADVLRCLPPVEGRSWAISTVDARQSLIDVAGAGDMAWLPGAWSATITAVALPDTKAKQ